MLRVGAGERVDDVEVAPRRGARRPSSRRPSKCSSEIGVDVPPPDPLLRAGLADDELVLGGAAGVLAGVDGERAALDDQALSALNAWL